jgi:hypothetical protein
MSGVIKITTKMVKFILGDAKPLIINGIINFLAIVNIVDEGLNETNLSHFKMICHSDTRIWVKKGQIIHSYISQLKDTGNILNTTLFKSSSDVAIFNDDISDMEKGSF